MGAEDGGEDLRVDFSSKPWRLVTVEPFGSGDVILRFASGDTEVRSDKRSRTRRIAAGGIEHRALSEPATVRRELAEDPGVVLLALFNSAARSTGEFVEVSMVARRMVDLGLSPWGDSALVEWAATSDRIECDGTKFRLRDEASNADDQILELLATFATARAGSKRHGELASELGTRLAASPEGSLPRAVAGVLGLDGFPRLSDRLDESFIETAPAGLLKSLVQAAEVPGEIGFVARVVLNTTSASPRNAALERLGEVSPNRRVDAPRREFVPGDANETPPVPTADRLANLAGAFPAITEADLLRMVLSGAAAILTSGSDLGVARPSLREALEGAACSDDLLTEALTDFPPRDVDALMLSFGPSWEARRRLQRWLALEAPDVLIESEIWGSIGVGELADISHDSTLAEFLVSDGARERLRQAVKRMSEPMTPGRLGVLLRGDPVLFELMDHSLLRRLVANPDVDERAQAWIRDAAEAAVGNAVRRQAQLAASEKVERIEKILSGERDAHEQSRAQVTVLEAQVARLNEALGQAERSEARTRAQLADVVAGSRGLSDAEIRQASLDALRPVAKLIQAALAGRVNPDREAGSVEFTRMLEAADLMVDGRVGSMVAFDPLRHELPGNVDTAPGDSVEVIEPAIIVGTPGESIVLARGLVRPTS